MQIETICNNRKHYVTIPLTPPHGDCLKVKNGIVTIKQSERYTFTFNKTFTPGQTQEVVSQSISDGDYTTIYLNFVVLSDIIDDCPIINVVYSTSVQTIEKTFNLFRQSYNSVNDVVKINTAPGDIKITLTANIACTISTSYEDEELLNAMRVK